MHWELAKGHLRATVAALGQMRTDLDDPAYAKLEAEVTSFIDHVEEKELHLP